MWGVLQTDSLGTAPTLQWLDNIPNKVCMALSMTPVTE